MTEEETVLTTRRALLLEGRRWTPGRLRITDRVVRFTRQDGEVVEVAVTTVSAVRVARLPRSTLVLELPSGTLRLRCYAVAAVAGLLQR